MAEVKLSKGLVAIVDDEDLALVSQCSWWAHNGTNGRKYAAGAIKGKRWLMHRLIMNPPAGLVVDHINRDSLDNRKQNMRICTQTQNTANSVFAPGKSGYRGVLKPPQTVRFAACISVDNKKRHLGYFDTAEEAAMAFDLAAVQLRGEFAKINFPHLAGAIARGELDARIESCRQDQRYLPHRSPRYAAGRARGATIPSHDPT